MTFQNKADPVRVPRMLQDVFHEGSRSSWSILSSICTSVVVLGNYQWKSNRRDGIPTIPGLRMYNPQKG